MQIFVENIEDDILFLTFYCFSWWISIFEVNISHPIIVFTFCYINVDSEGLKFSCNKHSNVFTVLEGNVFYLFIETSQQFFS